MKLLKICFIFHYKQPFYLEDKFKCNITLNFLKYIMTQKKQLIKPKLNEPLYSIYIKELVQHRHQIN